MTWPAQLQPEEEVYLHPYPPAGKGSPGRQSPSQQGPGEPGGDKTIPLHPLKRIKRGAWGMAHMLSPSYLLSDFLLLLLLKPLQRAARFQEPGSNKQTSLWLPAGLGRIRGWGCFTSSVPTRLEPWFWRWFFDILYKGLFFVAFLS